MDLKRVIGRMILVLAAVIGASVISCGDDPAEPLYPATCPENAEWVILADGDQECHGGENFAVLPDCCCNPWLICD